MELMVVSNTLPVAHAADLLKATPPQQHADLKPVERDKTCQCDTPSRFSTLTKVIHKMQTSNNRD